MTSFTIIGVLVAIGVVAGLVVLAVKRALDGNKSSMQKLAAALGLPLLRGERGRPGPGLLKVGPRTYFILDLWKDRELNIYHIVKGYGKMQTVSAALDVPVEISKEFRMSITSAVGSGMGSLLPGASLASTGDDAFDARFIVKSSAPEAVRRLLTKEMRDLLTQVWDASDVRGALSVREGRVHYEEHGWILSEGQRRRFVAMAGLANQFASAVVSSEAGVAGPQ